MVRLKMMGVGLAGAVALPAAVFATAAAAHTFHPTTTADHAPNGCSAHDCTLREAVIRANSTAARDTIVLEGGRTYGRSGTGTNEDAAHDGDLDVTSPLKIRSSGRHLATVDAEHNERVFDLFAPVKLVRLKITHGDTSTLSSIDAVGGGIFTDAGSGVTPYTPTLVHSVVTRNRSVQYGGGIGGYFGANLRSTRVTHNVGRYAGGGIATFGGSATIKKSTISGNRTHDPGGGVGGGIDLQGGSLTIKSSTISGNTAEFLGGAILNDAEGTDLARLVNTTVAHNTPDGVYNDPNATTTLNAVTVARNEGAGLAGSPGILARNSLIALNTPDCSTSVVSAGHNLVGDTSGCSGFSASSGDVLNLLPAAVGLRELDDNGGPTRTMALRSGSQAIGNAGADSPPRDQRGVARHDPDIGAFERAH